MTRIHEGCGTRNWSLRTAEGRFFVKEYPAQARVAEERQALELSIYARDCGIPTPRVIATRSDDLVCVSGDAMFVLFEWADGCTAKRSLSPEQMAQAGRVLGEMHRHFRTVESRLPSETSRWLEFDAADKLSEVERYVEIIRGKPERDDFDRRTLPLLIERKRLVRKVPKILLSLPNLTTQVIHNDYGLPNVMFKDGRVSAVVDFQPPRPFLIAYEIGRIAFGPENFTSSGWIRESIRPDTGVLQGTPGCRPRHLLRPPRLACAAHTKHVRRQTALHSPRRAAGRPGSLLVSACPCGPHALREPGDGPGDFEIGLGDERRRRPNSLTPLNGDVELTPSLRSRVR